MRLSGRFRSALIIGGQGIRARKLRTFLSMISLFLGVLAVVVVQAASETAERALLSNLELNVGRDGTDVLHVPAAGATVALQALAGRADAVGAVTTSAIIGEPGVRPVNQGGMPFDLIGDGDPSGGYTTVCDARGMCFGVDRPPGDAAPAGQAIELRLTALTGDVRRFRPFRQEAGRWLDFGSDPSYGPRLVVNREAAKGFSRYQVPAEMRIDGAPANPTPRIIGVVDDGMSEPMAYLRVDELRNWLPDIGATEGGYGGGVQVMMDPGSAEFQRTLRLRLAGAGVPADQMLVETINSKKQLSKELALMRWVFLAMAGLVLLIGVAGILNVGLATVGERVEEFALRRAVGTPRVLLAGIVLAETLLTGLLTAAAAIGVAALALRAAAAFVDTQDPLLRDLSFPWQAGVAGIVAGLIAGLLGGFIPAVRAARIPISTVMRA